MPMKCVVVTPEKTALTQSADFVVMPLIDGECGVLPNHAPLIARLGAGELRITGTDGKLTLYYVEGGFAEVLENTIALLTMYALPAEELDLADAERELETVRANADDSPELAGMRQERLYHCRAKIRLAQKMAAQKMAERTGGR